MYTLSYWNDLQNWKRIAESCFGYGNHITASRFHALKKMIDWRIEYVSGSLNFHGIPNDENMEAMLALFRICEFAGGNATKGEQQIYLHIFIGLCEEELQKEPNKENLAWKRAKLHLSSNDDFSDGKDFDEPYPPGDSADCLGNIPL